MKKIFTVLMAAMALFVSCSDEEGGGGSSVTLRQLNVDASEAKTAFISGQDAFTAENLVVQAVYSNKKEVLEPSDYTVSGYESYADENGILTLKEGNSLEVKITVSYKDKKASYEILISRPVARIRADFSNACLEFFKDEDAVIQAVEPASDGEEQEQGVIVRAFYLDEGDEGYEAEEGEPVVTGVTFTEIDSSVSGRQEVKASFLGKESEAAFVNVYEIKGSFSETYEKGSAVPSLSSVKVYLGEDEVTENVAVKLYDSSDREYTKETFAVGTYTVRVTAGSLVKDYFMIEVPRPESEKFVVLSSESKVEGAALQIVIDASDMNLKWAEDVEKVSPEVSLSEGTIGQAGAFFTAPAANGETGILEKFMLQVVLSSPVQTTVAEVSAVLGGTKYRTTVRFAGGKCIPSDYVPAELILDKKSVELACGASVSFTVKDGKYGLDYSSDVTWFLPDDVTGSSIEAGLFTASVTDEVKEVTVRACLKSNPEVYAEAVVSINPDKADVSSIYNVNLSNTMNNGAFFNGEISWSDSQYKVAEVSSKSAGVQGIVNVSGESDKVTFMVNLTSAEYRGRQASFVFRVKTESGSYYDVSVTYNDFNVTAGGSTTEIIEVAVEEAVLNPRITLSKNSVELEKDGTAEIDISFEEIAGFSAEKLSASSTDESVVAASVNGTKLVLAWLKEGTASVTVSYDGSASITASVDVRTLAGEIVFEELPVIPAGNQKTKVEGASVWIYLDNSALGIRGGDPVDFEITVTDTESDTAVPVLSKEYNDFGSNTVRLYLTFGSARSNLRVDLQGKVNGTNYRKSVEFKNGDYYFDFVPESLVILPASRTAETGSTVSFTVKDSRYGLDITDKCTFTAENASVSGNRITLGTEPGTVTVTVTFNDDESVSSTALITVVDSGSVSHEPVPVLLSDTEINGNQIFLYLDNSIIGIGVKNKYEDEMTIVFKDTDSGEVLPVTPIEYNAWEGNKFRLYAVLPSGGHDNAEMSVEAVFGDKVFGSTITFAGGKAVSNE